MMVAIEGLDGSGKTTQTRMLVDKLKEDQRDVVSVRPVYFLSRYFFRDNPMVSPRQKRTASKNLKISRVLIALLGYFYALTSYFLIKFCFTGKVIICDRYFYQFLFDLFGDFSLNIVKIFPKPDVTFFLYGDLELFYSRMDSFDKQARASYYVDVLDFYNNLATAYNFIRINANSEKNVINEEIFSYLNKILE